MAGASWQTRRPPPAGATTPAIASRSLLFDQIPSVFEQVASAALVTSSPGRGARQLARRRPCSGAWRRARRRRREEPVPDISRELSREDLWPGVLVAVALVLWLGMLVAPGI